jgi:hypothetical protein
MKIRLVGVELFHADRQTHRRTDRRIDRQTGRHDEAYSRFSQFSERAWKCYLSLFQIFQYVGDFFCTLRVIESIVKERNIWACFRGLLQKKPFIFQINPI